MPFEDFYKSADQHAHRWRLCLIAATVFIAAYFCLPFFVSWLLSSTPEAAPVVSKKQWREADELCMNLPKPERFSLTDTGKGKNVDGAARVVYTYHSERGFEEIIPQFLIWSEEYQWERVFSEVYEQQGYPDKAFYFRKGNRRVSIRYFDLRKDNNPDAGAQYEILCTVEKP